jgi:Flp pilus assembly protein TadD
MAVEGSPESGRAQFLLGRELLRAGRKEEARAQFDRLLALRPDAAPEITRLVDSFR